MFTNSILASLAASLLISTGYGSPLFTEKVTTDVVTIATTENPAVSFGTFTDRGCTSGQKVWANPDDGCHQLPGQGMQVWWIANTCRIFAYKGGDCSASSGEIQVFPGQCYDIAQYNTIKAFCH
ncbi:hypothetical protein GRF29_8g1618182 [Pseudopithomyces chartarum]|uniref:Uncharacterized protein n=1 Tax=Pseudopithomyces chartarum TaxID=1892770 RepID=A0AAN6RJV2_9PLEO|nr:hypothetical protein GRF29_8g1618182 [Pseudopithomyces chartarum]